MANYLNISGSAAVNGAIPIGSAGVGNAAWTTITAGSGIGISNGSNTITLSASGTTPLSFPTDSGTAIPAANALTVAGTHNINTSGAGSTVTVANNNTAAFGDLSVVLAGSPSMTLTSGDLTISGTGGGAGGNINIPQTNATNTLGTVNMAGTRFLYSDVATTSTYLGKGAGNTTNTTSGNTNVYIGADAGGAGGATTQTVAIGHRAGRQLQLASANNIAIGKDSLLVGTTASSNVAIGSLSLFALTTGSFNTAIGSAPAASAYTGAESSNILINNAGVLGESNKMRLGTSGSTTSRVDATYIAGIDGVNVGSVAKVLTMASEQVGTATITAGTNVTVTAGANTITIAANSAGQTAMYREVLFAASPYTADTLSPDYYISADTTGGAITILLPNAPTTGRVYIVKDQVGNAGAVNITVSTVGGAVLIDGATSFVMNSNYESANFIFGGAAYEVF